MNFPMFLEATLVAKMFVTIDVLTLKSWRGMSDLMLVLAI